MTIASSNAFKKLVTGCSRFVVHVVGHGPLGIHVIICFTVVFTKKRAIPRFSPSKK